MFLSEDMLTKYYLPSLVTLSHPLSTVWICDPAWIVEAQEIEVLQQFCIQIIIWMSKQYSIEIYLWSISSMISPASLLLCVRYRYSSTHVTRWSLKVALISWCRMSDEISSWISAQGKSSVNGYGYVQFQNLKWVVFTYYFMRVHTILIPQLVFESPVQSGLFAFLGKTKTRTSPQWSWSSPGAVKTSLLKNQS
jgi:hypothetical protein